MKNKSTITIVADYSKIARGHRSHRSGAGIHGDRRTKRNRTRSDQKRQSLQDW